MSKYINTAMALEVLNRVKMIHNLGSGNNATKSHADSMIKAELKQCGVGTIEELESLVGVPWVEDQMETTRRETELMDVFTEVLGNEGESFVPDDEVQDVIEQIIPAAPTPKEIVMKRNKLPTKVIGGIQLQPTTELVPGKLIVPKFEGEPGVVTGIYQQDWEIEVATPSSFRNLPVQYVTFWSKDNDIKSQMLAIYIKALNKNDIRDGKSPEDWRIPVGNIKKEDCVLGVMTKKQWDQFFGYDIRHINMWKAILSTMTPTTVRIEHKYSNIKTIKLRVLKALRTEGGYPEHDGDIITYARHEFYKHSDLQKDADGKLIIGEDGLPIPKEDVKVKKVDRNWQVRADGFDVNGLVLPKIKAKIFSDQSAYFKMCERFGYNPDAQDGFITKDNLKTLKHAFRHGDIIEFDIKYLRNIKCKMKDWASSIGAQCIASSNHKYTREILEHHGILKKAETIKSAARLEMHSVFKVFSADKEASWDDSITFPVQCSLARYVDGQWYIPRFLKDTFYPRLESYYRDYGIKARVGDDGYYLQGDDSLDIMENQDEKDTGTLIFYVLLPDTGKFRDKLEIGSRINIGRDPWAGPSNMMTFKVVGFVKGLDYMLLSWQALYAMYADVDGDTQKFEWEVANKSSAFYPCMRRRRPEVKEEKPLGEPCTMGGYIKQHIEIGQVVLKAASDTGSLDLTTRQLIEERLYAGIPFSNRELMELSEYRQEAIDGMKHVDSGVSENAKDIIIKMYGVDGKKAKTKASPASYRLLRKDAGLSTANEIKRFEERIRLLNICNTHENHPYKGFNDSLKGIRGPNKKDSIIDSCWLRDQFKAIWLRIEKNFNEKKYNWTKEEVVSFAIWMSNNHKAESVKYLKLRDEERKEKFTKLKEEHRKLIKDRCIDFFGSDECRDAIVYQNHLVVYLGLLGFGRAYKTVTNEMGDDVMEAYGRAGGAIKHMLEERILDVVQIINNDAVNRGEFPEVNPLLSDIREAVIRNREKQKEKEKAKLARLQDESNIED